MVYSNKNMFSGPRVIAVLLLYIPFLLVHGYFNYCNPIQISVDAVRAGYHNTIKSTSGNNVTFVKKATGDKAGIRLNKRFQPAATSILFPFFAFHLTPYFKEVNVFQHYVNPHLPRLYLFCKTLRGPPAVV